jgi:hypothetical protein
MSSLGQAAKMFDFLTALPTKLCTAVSRAGCWAALLALLAFAPGCQWTRNYYESLKGEGFPQWGESMAAARSGNANAKPSGFFTDRRSEQIERSLGGGF